jgi:8-oxo-dGTP pyrophosphatase MutT (NUDIX family)
MNKTVFFSSLTRLEAAGASCEQSEVGSRSFRRQSEVGPPEGRVMLILDRAQQALELAAVARSSGFLPVVAHTTDEAMRYLDREEGRPPPAVAVMSLGRGERELCWPLLDRLKSMRLTTTSRTRTPPCTHPTFTIMNSKTACDSPTVRLEGFARGARMVTASAPQIRRALEQIHTCSGALALALAVDIDIDVEGSRSETSREGHTPATTTHQCPRCGLDNFSPENLSTHCSLYHNSELHVGREDTCPICGHDCSHEQGGRGIVVHLRCKHGPAHLRGERCAPFAAFSWVVCRRDIDGKFLMVNEPAGLCGSSRGVPAYWLPAGRVDPGESCVEAAVRECEEEAGVRVEPTGVLRFMLEGGSSRARSCIRVVLAARPLQSLAHAHAHALVGEGTTTAGGLKAAPDTYFEPKTVPDFESCGAIWTSGQQLTGLRQDDFRGRDPVTIFPKIERGSLVAHSLDTPAFAALEALVKRRTAARWGESNLKEENAEVAEVWRALRQTYPVTAFET